MSKKETITLEIVNGNQGVVSGPLKFTHKLYEAFKIKHPNAWHIRMYGRNNGWDGYVKYISDSGKFAIGLLPKIYNTCKEWGLNIKLIDRRPHSRVSPVLPKVLGDKVLRENQKRALECLIFNRVGDMPFQICASNLSVGFGKTLIFAGIHEAYQRQLKSVLLVNSSDLYKQFKKEIPELLPGEDVGFIQGSKDTHWGNFTVCMVQTLATNIKKHQMQLAKADIVLIDEADVIDNRTYKTVITHLYNSKIRIGLSGTLYMSKLKKDLIHNMNVMSFIGESVNEVSLKDTMDLGSSTPVVIKLCYPEFHCNKDYDDYNKEYRAMIIDNKLAYDWSIERSKFNIKNGRLPVLVVCKFIDHCERLGEYYQKEFGKKYTVRYVHHETKDRANILKQFREGKIDILIATTIISRGQNFPQLQYLQNICCMDSNEKSIQILGRLVRKHEGKVKAYMDDLMFPGTYLKRHSNHRKNYYLKQRLKVIKVGNSWAR